MQCHYTIVSWWFKDINMLHPRATGARNHLCQTFVISASVRWNYANTWTMQNSTHNQSCLFFFPNLQVCIQAIHFCEWHQAAEAHLLSLLWRGWPSEEETSLSKQTWPQTPAFYQAWGGSRHHWQHQGACLLRVLDSLHTLSTLH